MARIMIVEDDTEARICFSEMLSISGHEIRSVSTVKSAEEVLATWEPMVVLLDIMLPGESGIALAWRIRKENKSIGILVISAVLDWWEPEDLIDCGVDFFLPKPIGMEELLAATNLVIAKRHGKGEAPLGALVQEDLDDSRIEKVCPVCRKSWPTLTALYHDPEISFMGQVPPGGQGGLGLCFIHTTDHCRTTFSLATPRNYPSVYSG